MLSSDLQGTWPSDAMAPSRNLTNPKQNPKHNWGGYPAFALAYVGLVVKSSTFVPATPLPALETSHDLLGTHLVSCREKCSCRGVR